MVNDISTIRYVGGRTKQTKVTGGCPGKFSDSEISRTVQEQWTCMGELFCASPTAAPNKALIHAQREFLCVHRMMEELFRIPPPSLMSDLIYIFNSF